jgi:hypothetical protein
LSCEKLEFFLKCLLRAEKLMVIMTASMLDWVFENQEAHHWHGFLSVFFGFWICRFLTCRWCIYVPLDVILCRRSHLELVDMFLKAATDVSSYSQQPSPRSFVYVRTRISTAEHGVSEAAWAVQGILNICLKNKEEILQPAQSFCQVHKLFLFTR